MTFFKAVIIFALIYITSASFSEQLGVHGDSLNGSVLDYPITVPQHVLNKLTDITDFSKGLLGMWRKSRALTNKNLLKPEYENLKYKVCRELIFYEPPKCHKATASLKRSQLVNYYNELVIQLRMAENFINTSISREIEESKRTDVENQQREVIESLRENILPLIDVVLNTTDDEVDCNRTEIIVNKKTSLYSQYCTSIQTANLFLSQITLELYQIFNAINMAQKNDADDSRSSNGTETINSDYDETKVWCIL